MRALIVGSGVVGLATAYALRRRGHEVTVVERRSAPGLETSYANGALLTPSMSEPWNTPGCWRFLLGSIGRSDSPLLVRLGSLPRMAPWGARFLMNSRLQKFRRHAANNLDLALYSLKVMGRIRAETGVRYSNRHPGSLRIFRNGENLQAACDTAERFGEQGLRFRRLSREEAIALEPSLSRIQTELHGAVHYPVDEVGDAYEFSTAMSKYLLARGVEFLFGTDVRSLQLSGRRISVLNSSRGPLEADSYVVSAGSYSGPLLRGTGIRIPVQPVKGYSLTFDQSGERPMLSTPIVDDDLHTVVVPLRKAIRIAGTAEFAGYDLSRRPSRIDGLRAMLTRIFPEVTLRPTAERAWCGLRAVSVDGVPIIGGTPINNLFLNTGHGHLGWTMAAGSGEMLAGLMDGEPPALRATSYEFARFRTQE